MFIHIIKKEITELLSIFFLQFFHKPIVAQSFLQKFTTLHDMWTHI